MVHKAWRRMNGVFIRQKYFKLNSKEIQQYDTTKLNYIIRA